MNKVILTGRLTSDPEVKQTEQSTIAKYRLAVDRRFKKEGEQTADFISCVAFGKSAEFVDKYLLKGMKIAIVGRIQTGSYTKDDGQKVYTTDVIVEEHEFCESKVQGGSEQRKEEPQTESAPMQTPSANEEFVLLPDDDELTF